MIKCEALTTGEMRYTITPADGVERVIILSNRQAHDFDTEHNFQLQEADEAYFEFQQSHKD